MSMARNRREDEIQRMLGAADQRSGTISGQIPVPPAMLENQRTLEQQAFEDETRRLLQAPGSRYYDNLNMPKDLNDRVRISVGDVAPVANGVVRGEYSPEDIAGARIVGDKAFMPPAELEPLPRVTPNYQLNPAGQAALSMLGEQQVQSPYSMSSPMPTVDEETQRLITERGGSIGKSGVRLNAPIRQQADPVQKAEMDMLGRAFSAEANRISNPLTAMTVPEGQSLPTMDELVADYQMRLRGGGQPQQAPQAAPVQATPAIGPPSIEMPMPQRNSGLSAGAQQQPEPQAQGNRIRPPGFNTMSPKNQQIVMQYEQIYPQMSTQEIIDRLTRSSAR